MKEYKVLGINTNLWRKSATWLDEFDFDSSVSFSDYDAVIIDTGNILINYEEADSSPYLDKVLLSVYDSHRIVEDYKRLKKQITEFLKHGKLVFVIVDKNESCYICRSSSEYYAKDSFDTNSFLPCHIDIQYLYGEKYEKCCNGAYKEFFDNTGDLISYSAQFMIKNAIPLLKVPNSDRMISAEVQYENGKLILLPCIIDDPNDEAIERSRENYLSELSNLINRLYSSDAKLVLPEWTYSFQILDEKKQQEKLNSDLNKLEILKIKVAKEQTKLEVVQSYKALLSETGSALESISTKVLSNLGFKILETEPGRSDIIAKYKEQYVVIEVKGVTKTAAEKHAAQLEKWVAEFIDKNGFQPKPLLIVNAFKDTPIFERTEDAFPKQMLKYSRAREHALVSTTQLLCLYIDIKTNPDKKESLIKELLSTIGVYNRYTNISDYLQPIEKDED